MANPEVATELRDMFDLLLRTGFGPACAQPVRIGRYRILSPLGSGGMGAVLLAEVAEGSGADADAMPQGRRVALKVIRSDQALHPQMHERLRREVAALARLSHPAIVRVLDAGTQDGWPYYAMDLVAGCTLAHALKRLANSAPGGLTLTGSDLATALELPAGNFARGWTETCVDLVRQVAEALAHAHEHGVLHRDLKPANIMVGLNGRPILIDFGLASVAGTERVTRTGAQVGSLAYMAPELVRGDVPASGLTDVYALGVTLYEVLTLATPFAGGNEFQVRKRILTGDAPPLRQRLAAVSPEVERLCQAAMDVDPRWRVPSARAFADDLGAILTLRPLRARRPGPVVRARRLAMRHPVLTVLAAFCSLLLMALVAVLLQQVRTARIEQIVEMEAEWQAGRGDFEAASTLYTQARWMVPLDPAAVPFADAWLHTSRRVEVALKSSQPAAKDLLAAWSIPCAKPTTAGFVGPGFFEPQGMEKRLAHALLRVGCVDSLPGLLRLRETMQREREVAANIVSCSIEGDEARAAWRDFAAALALTAKFNGTSVFPQLGLLPLGRDPVTGQFLFWHVATGPKPHLDGAGSAGSGDTGVVFELVPPGADGDPAFFLATRPLTRGQWLRLSAQPLTDESALGEVAVGISWIDATRNLERYAMQLPTRRQWELGMAHRTELRHFEWCMTRVEAAAANRQAGMLQPTERVNNDSEFGGALGYEANRVVSPRVALRPAMTLRPVRLSQVTATFRSGSFDRWTGGFAGQRNSGGASRLRDSGGASGAHVEVVTCSGLAFYLLIDPEAAWNPAKQGRWEDVVMTLQGRNVSGWGAGHELSVVIEQDGIYYFGLNDNHYMGIGAATAWHPFATLPLRPEQFVRVWPRDFDTPSGRPIFEGPHPSFEPEAGTMHFGFGVFALSTGVYREAIDEWQVDIRATAR